MPLAIPSRRPRTVSRYRMICGDQIKGHARAVARLRTCADALRWLPIPPPALPRALDDVAMCEDVGRHHPPCSATDPTPLFCVAI